MTAYWRQVKTRGGYVDPRVFYDYYSEIEELLAEEGIEIIEDAAYRYVLKDDVEVATEEGLLRQVTEHYGYDVRHPDIINHDAFHRLLILQLRGGNQNSSFIETRYWFLTCDSKLPKYDRVARSGKRLTTPYCVLVSQWLQAIRPLVSLVEGYETTQIDFFDSPFLRAFKGPPSSMVDEVMTRLAMREDFVPRIAAKMVTNRHFVEQFAEAASEEEQTAAVDSFYGDYVREIEDGEQVALKQRDQARARVEELEARLALLEGHKMGRVVIGHSGDPLRVLIQDYLTKEFGLEVVVHELGYHTRDWFATHLQNLLSGTSFAIFIFTEEDRTEEASLQKHDKALHEIGLFQGSLGFERVVLLVQKGSEDISEVAGSHHITFDREHIEGAFDELVRYLETEGLLTI